MNNLISKYRRSFLVASLSSMAVLSAYFYVVLRQTQEQRYFKMLITLHNKILTTSINSKAIYPLSTSIKSIKNEQGINFMIKFVNSLQNKPPASNKNPFIEPIEQGIFITKLSSNHNLLLNKFPVNQHHCIVATKSFESQSSQLNKEDLLSTYTIIECLKGFGFYNSCTEGMSWLIQCQLAGSSQPHKHLQVLPDSAYQSADVLRKIKLLLNDQSQNESQRYRLNIFKNIKHSIRKIHRKKEVPLEQTLYNIYIDLLRDLIGLNSIITTQHIESLKYNLIITEQFMMIVLRKQEKYNDLVTINAVGFTGSILIKNDEQLKALGETSLIKVLESISEVDEQFNDYSIL